MLCVKGASRRLRRCLIAGGASALKDTGLSKPLAIMEKQHTVMRHHESRERA
jgi:hypothetical protein